MPINKSTTTRVARASEAACLYENSIAVCFFVCPICDQLIVNRKVGNFNKNISSFLNLKSQFCICHV